MKACIHGNRRILCTFFANDSSHKYHVRRVLFGHGEFDGRKLSLNLSNNPPLFNSFYGKNQISFRNFSFSKKSKRDVQMELTNDERTHSSFGIESDSTIKENTILLNTSSSYSSQTIVPSYSDNFYKIQAIILTSFQKLCSFFRLYVSYSPIEYSNKVHHLHTHLSGMKNDLLNFFNFSLIISSLRRVRNIRFRNLHFFKYAFILFFCNACVFFAFVKTHPSSLSYTRSDTKTSRSFLTTQHQSESIPFKKGKKKEKTNHTIDFPSPSTHLFTSMNSFHYHPLESKILSLWIRKKELINKMDEKEEESEEESMVDKEILSFEHAYSSYPYAPNEVRYSSEPDSSVTKAQVLKRIHVPSNVSSAYKKVKQKVKEKVSEELDKLADMESLSHSDHKRQTKDPASAASRDLTKFVEEIKLEALKSGVSELTLNDALTGVKTLPEVQERSITQSEFALTAENYIQSVVSDSRVQNGVIMYRQYREILNEIEKEYNVPGHYVLAIWGVESSYGVNMGKFKIIQVLLTHAFSSSQRNSFFRKELIHALHILDRRRASLGSGAVESNPTSLVGSWAGAMGQCQFMPSSFQAYAAPYKHNRIPDIWKSHPDVLASIANYLSKNGWQKDEPYGQLVQLPSKFDRSNLSGFKVEKTVWNWKGNFGILSISNQLPLAGSTRCSLIIPSKSSTGLGYLATKNFQAVLRYNQSTLYAMAVGELAHKILMFAQEA